MSNTLIKFDFERFELRSIIDDKGEPWFVARDICNILGLSNLNMAIQVLDDTEKGVNQIDTLGGKQSMVIVNESGMFALILRSDKPKAKELRKWVTSEVLPSIRKTGSYSLRSNAIAIPQDNDDDSIAEMEMIAKIATQTADNRRRIKAMEQVQEETRAIAYEAIRKSDETRLVLETGTTHRGYSTVLQFVNLNKVKISKDNANLARVGKIAASICRQKGISIEPVPHSKYGECNSYPVEILAEAIEVSKK